MNDPLGLQSDSTVKPFTPPPCNGPDCPTGKMAEVKELQPVSVSNNKNSSGSNVESMITILGWLGLGGDYYEEMIYKGDWLYKNSKGVIQSIFDTKWGSDETPKNLGNIKRYSNNAQKSIRATKAVKLIKTGGKIIIVVSVASDVYNVFTVTLRPSAYSSVRARSIFSLFNIFLWNNSQHCPAPDEQVNRSKIYLPPSRKRVVR